MARAFLLVDLKEYLRKIEEKIAFFHDEVDDETMDQMKEVVAAIKGSYDVLDQKVNYTDIVDDLNSDDASLPLSARQGKELKRLIDAKPSGSGGSGGAGGITEETDPTVPAWAKRKNPPSLTELGAEAAGSAATVQTHLTTHVNDTTPHVSVDERNKWNAYKGIKSVAQTVEGEGSNADNVLTITLTDDFVTNFVVKNGGKGDKGDDGTDGTSVTISDITESTEDGGGNVIAFSDGKKITIKNGSKGDTGKDGEDGHTPVKGTDYFTEAEKAEIAEQAADNVGDSISLGIGADGQAFVYVNGEPVGTGIAIYKGGDVFGYVDANNNIVLRGNLTDGKYSVKYEMADGTVRDIGDLVLTDESDEPDVPDVPTGGNLSVPDEWVLEHRLSTGDGTVKEIEGHVVTNFIPAKQGNVLRIKGLDLKSFSQDSEGKYRYATVLTYDSNKVYNVAYAYTGATIKTSPLDGAQDYVTTTTDDIDEYTILLVGTDKAQKAPTSTEYIRISGMLKSGYTKDTVDIRINEKIP